MPRSLVWAPWALSNLAYVSGSNANYGAQRILAHDDAVDAPNSAARAIWMQRAIQALDDLVSPCPFAPFGTAIVNHTAPHDELICIGANAVVTGNPALHGEIAAINNCTAVLTDPDGSYRLPPSEALEAYKDLTLYTTAEPCPMCASAIRWAGFRECIFGTSIHTLMDFGWNQLNLTSHELFEHSVGLKTRTRLVGGVLSGKTDPLFAWQFGDGQPCPLGCAPDKASGTCRSTDGDSDKDTAAEL